ncbi:Ig-like domain-containing protein [Arcobacter sp.]|uniref:Ig-like domain-containing protein n=1 Tax=Arcobacter sp. TaxID=1872629 RepID=UPI003D13818E
MANQITIKSPNGENKLYDINTTDLINVNKGDYVFIPELATSLKMEINDGSLDITFPDGHNILIKNIVDLISQNSGEIVNGLMDKLDDTAIAFMNESGQFDEVSFFEQLLSLIEESAAGNKVKTLNIIDDVATQPEEVSSTVQQPEDRRSRSLIEEIDLQNGGRGTTIDDGATLTKTSVITANDINEAPTLTVETTKTVAEDGSTSITYTASDVEGAVSVSAVAEHGTVVVNDNGTITYTPNENYNGLDTITVTATDSEGAKVSTTSAVTISSDGLTLIPTADITDESDTGISNSDNITNNNTPTISGVTENGATVTITDKDGNVVGSTTADENGNYSITTSELSDGTQTLTITATDSEGNTGVETQTITVDTSASDISALAITDIVDNNGDYTSVTMTGTGAEAGNTITIYDEDGNSVGTATVQANGTWSADISNLSATGINDNEFFKVSETDIAGNETAQTDSTHYWHGAWSGINTESTDDFVMAGSGNDVINTDATLSGTNENGYVTSANDDTNDKVVIDGGDGNDTVTFGHNMADYTITTDANGNVIVTEGTSSDSDGDGKGDVTELRNVETVKFADGTYDVATGNFIPTAQDDSVSTLEDTALTLSVDDFGFSDDDGGSLSAVQITSLPVAGALTLNGIAVNAGDEISVDDINSGNLIFTPASNSDVDVSFDYKVSDGSSWSENSATTTINIEAVADAPINVSISVEATGNVSSSNVNLVVNGSFEDVSGTDAAGNSVSNIDVVDGGWQGMQSMTGWTLISNEGADATTMEVHNKYHAGIGSTDGDNYMDLGETNYYDNDNDNTQIGQVINAVDGVSYSLSFDFIDKALMQWEGTDSASLEVYWGGERVATIDGNNTTWETQNIELVGGSGDGSNLLSFKETGTGNDNAGMAIDNIYMAPTESMLEYNVDVSAMLADTDGSESLSVTLNGIPTGATLEVGHAGAEAGTWVIPVDGTSVNLTDVKMYIPESAGKFAVTAIATATDVNGDENSVSNSAHVEIIPNVQMSIGDAQVINDSVGVAKEETGTENSIDNDEDWQWNNYKTTTGTSSDDSIELGLGTNQTVYAGEGDDYIKVKDGYSNSGVAVYGEEGNDYIRLNLNDNQKAYGGTGNDTIEIKDSYAWVHNAHIEGGAGNDKAIMNTLSLGSHFDGGEGTDTLVLKGNKDDYRITHNDDGTYSIATIDYWGNDNGMFKMTAQNIENIEFSSGESIQLSAPLETQYEYPISLNLDIDGGIFSSVKMDNLPDNVTLKDSNGNEILANEDGSYNVSLDEEGNANVTLVSSSEIDTSDLNSITSVVDTSIITGTSGDDTITFEINDTVDGGAGTDTLVIEENTILDFDSMSAQNIEKINLENNNQLDSSTLDVEDVITLTDDDNILKIIGDAGDEIGLTNDAGDVAWEKSDVQVEDGDDTFDVWTNDNVTVYIDTDITVTDI